MAHLECKSCRWRWLPRVEKPSRCPRCQSYWWNGKPSNFVDGRVARPQFQPPSEEEVRAYFKASGWSAIDGQGFYGWHTGKGWPGIVDWKGAALGWMARVRKEA